MVVVALDHISIATAKLEDTCAFYCDVLGFRKGYRPNFGIAGYWLYVGDGSIVHLQQADEEEHAIGTVRHFALRVSNLEDCRRRLDECGVAYRLAQTPDGALDQIFLRDPSGAQLELVCRPSGHDGQRANWR